MAALTISAEEIMSMSDCVDHQLKLWLSFMIGKPTLVRGVPLPACCFVAAVIEKSALDVMAKVTLGFTVLGRRLVNTHASLLHATVRPVPFAYEEWRTTRTMHEDMFVHQLVQFMNILEDVLFNSMPYQMCFVPLKGDNSKYTSLQSKFDVAKQQLHLLSWKSSEITDKKKPLDITAGQRRDVHCSAGATCVLDVRASCPISRYSCRQAKEILSLAVEVLSKGILCMSAAINSMDQKLGTVRI